MSKSDERHATPLRDGCWSIADVKQWIEESAHLHMVAHKNPDMGLSTTPATQARCQACGLWADEYGFYAATLICGRCVRKAFPAGRTMTTAEIDGWYNHFRRHFTVVPECDLARFKTICDMAKAASVVQSESARLSARSAGTRIDEAMNILIEMHRLMDFEEEVVADSDCVSDPSAINAVFARAYALINGAPRSATERICEWLLDIDGIYHTACGHELCYDEPIEDCGVKFCQCCGGQLSLPDRLHVDAVPDSRATPK